MFAALAKPSSGPSYLRPPAPRRRRLQGWCIAAAWALAACGGLPPSHRDTALGAVTLQRAMAPAVGGTQPALGGGATRASLLDPETCGSCHAGHFESWRRSAHAHAADDPVFIAMNRRGQRETNGRMGSFCVNCHAPMAVREGATVDGLNLAAVPERLKSVTCYFCHTVKDVTGSHNNPLLLSGDTTMRGSIKDPVANEAHGSLYSPLHDRDQLASSRLCGSCHDVTQGHGVDIERTFAEWETSAFAKPQGGSTCGQCHMRQSPTLAPVAVGEHLPARRAHDHTFPGVDVVDDPSLTGPLAQANQAFLDHTLQAALCVMPQGKNAYALRVVLDNAASGHNFPSGSASDRRVWTEVIAYQQGKRIYQSGAGDDVAALMRAPDPDLWMLRTCLFDAQDKPVDMFWEAFGAESNALGALTTLDKKSPEFYASHRLQAFPREATGTLVGVPDSVTLRVRLQPVGEDVLASLVASGDLEPRHAHRPPIYTLANTHLTWTPAALASGAPTFSEHGVPVFCVSTAGFNASAPRRPAAQNSRCRP